MISAVRPAGAINPGLPPLSTERIDQVTLFDPKHADTADLLGMIRDIGEQLDGITERLDGLEQTLDGVGDRASRIEDDTAEITCKLAIITAGWPAGGTGPPVSSGKRP